MKIPALQVGDELAATRAFKVAAANQGKLAKHPDVQAKVMEAWEGTPYIVVHSFWVDEDDKKKVWVFVEGDVGLMARLPYAIAKDMRAAWLKANR